MNIWPQPISVPNYLGIYKAIVSDTNDPLSKNRIKLKIPQILGTAQSNWAVPAIAGRIVPPVGTKLLVEFIGGDRNQPTYFFDSPGTAGANTVVQMFGLAGTFGGMVAATTTASGHSFIATPIPSWQFGAGEAPFYTEVMSDGQVIISTVEFTENELKPTMDHAELNIFDPLRAKFYTLVIPTSTGMTKALQPGKSIGGTDCGAGDLRRILKGNTELLIFSCGGYYFGWDIGVDGLYPMLGFLNRNSTGDWVYNQGISLTSTQVHNTNSTVWEANITPTIQSGLNGSYWGTRMAGQMAVLPQSGNIVLGHYFNANGFNTGCISVVDPSGNLLAAYQIPNITPPSGTLNTGAVRDVESDPTSALGDERFVIVYDGFGTGIPQHPFQEFSYNANTHTITPVSVPCIPNDTGTNVGFSIIDSQGTLFVTTNIGLGAGNTSAYVKTAGNRSYAVNFPATGSWNTGPNSWGTLAPPDYSLGTPKQDGLGIFDGPMTVDPVTGTIVHPGASGKVGFVIPNYPLALGSNLISAADSGFETANLLSADDATFATSLGDWSSVLGSLTRVSPPVPPPFGTEAAQVSEALGSCQMITSHLPVIASTPYQFRTYFLASTTGRNCEAWVRWYTAGGATIVDSPHTTILDNPTSWTVCDVSGIAAPSNAAFVALIVQIDSSGAGENHYFSSNFLWNMSIQSDWTPFLTNVVRSTAAAHTGTFSMKITAPFNNEATAVTLASISVIPGQEYQATAWFLAGASQPSENCTVQIKWLDISNNVISTTSGTLVVQDNTSTWTQGRANGLAPPNAVSANVVIVVQIATANTENHLVDDVVFQTQPFTSVPPVDTGMTVMRTSYPTLSFGRGCISSRRYYVPLVNTSLTTAENAALNAGTYVPSFKPQFLVAIDLAKVLSR